METDQSLEFEHYLAQKLAMTVARLRGEMSNEEFLRWNVYYARKAQRDEVEVKSARGEGGVGHE